MEKGQKLIKIINAIVPLKIVQWRVLGPNDVGVITSWGSLKSQVRRGIIPVWFWEHATTLFTGERMIAIGFYGDAGRFTDIYLSWLLKSFPSIENAPAENDAYMCITREPIIEALKRLEFDLISSVRKQLELLKSGQPTQFKFQMIKHDLDERFYDNLLKEGLLTKPLVTPRTPPEKTALDEYFDTLIKQNTEMDLVSHIPAKVWRRMLSEVDQMVLKWEEENLNNIAEKYEKEYKKKEKEYEDQEQKNPKLKYNENFQTERHDELRKLRELLKDDRKQEEDRLKEIRRDFEVHQEALKEIETIIMYHKIKFVEAVYNLFAGEPFFSPDSPTTTDKRSGKKRIFIPNFSRIFGPLFTSEKIQMNMTASIFFTIVDPFKLVKNVGFEKAMLVLVSKLSSSLRSTISRLTLNEIYEERQKLMEMLRRELDASAESWGIDIKAVAIEEIFLEDPGFQRILDDRREMELYGEKRIEQKHTESNQIMIQGRQQAERLVMEAQAEKERDLTRVTQSIERAKVELDTRKIEAETLLKEKTYEAERILISTEAEVSEIALKHKAMTPNLLKRELIRNLPDIIEKMANSLQSAMISPEQFLQLITGQSVFQAIDSGLCRLQNQTQENSSEDEDLSLEKTDKTVIIGKRGKSDRNEKLDVKTYKSNEKTVDKSENSSTTAS